MVKADTGATKSILTLDQGNWMVYVNSTEAVAKYKETKDSNDLLLAIQTDDVFFSTQGRSGTESRPSKQELENQFGTTKREDIVARILTEGSIQEHHGHGKQGDTNVSNGPLGGGTGVHN